jgi:Glycosyltransferase family 87
MGHIENSGIANLSLSSHSPKWKNIALFFIVLACMIPFTFMAVYICMFMMVGGRLQGHDFISYWAAGVQLAHHANPYESAKLLSLQRSMGYPTGFEALVMRNPPSALLVALPFGYMSLWVGSFVWSLVLVVCLIASVWMLSSMWGNHKGLINLAGYCFGPALICIYMSQTALLSLIGIILFLRLHKSRQTLAGMSLWLCALKPHLFLPMCAVLILWVIKTRSYRVILGLVVSLAASSAIAMHFDLHVWSEYIAMSQRSGISREFIPCLGDALRLAVSPKSMGVQAVPAVLACIASSIVYWKLRHVWDWNRHGLVLLLVSLVVSPYAWITDNTLAIPAIMNAAYRTKSKSSIALLALASAAVEVEFLTRPYLHSMLFLWPAPFWLVWYVSTERLERSAHPSAITEDVQYVCGGIETTSSH